MSYGGTYFQVASHFVQAITCQVKEDWVVEVLQGDLAWQLRVCLVV